MHFARRFLLFALLTLLAPSVHAVTLDWDTVPWANGTLSHGFDIDPTKTGNDITVTVSGNTTALTTDLAAPNPMTPAIVNTFQGGLTTAQNTLSLAVNFTDSSQSVTVTVDFSALYASGVQNVSFTLFDIDLSNSGGNNYQDQLRNIIATSITGAQVAPTITTSASNTRTGAGTHTGRQWNQ